MLFLDHQSKEIDCVCFVLHIQVYPQPNFDVKMRSYLKVVADLFKQGVLFATWVYCVNTEDTAGDGLVAKTRTKHTDYFVGK